MPTTKRTPFPPRKHIAVGAMLSRTKADKQDLLIDLSKAYGTSGPAGRLARILNHLDQLRSDLDGLLCQELPPSVPDIEGLPVLHVYYGVPYN
jgi:hypothetical protein